MAVKKTEEVPAKGSRPAASKAAAKTPVKTPAKTAAKPVAKAATPPASRRSTSTAIVKAKPQAPAYESLLEEDVIDPELAEVDDSTMPVSMSNYSNAPVLDGSDLFIPRLRLAQGLTQEVQDGMAKPGEWLVLGGKPLKELRVVPVAMTKRREMRDPDTRGVVCRSGDAIHGVGNPGGECSACPMSQWVKGKPKGRSTVAKNEPPPCSFMYSYIVYILDINATAILEFSRTSIPAGKMLNTMIMQRGIGNFALKLSAASKQGPKGTFYNPVVAMAIAKPEELKKAMKEAQQL